MERQDQNNSANEKELEKAKERFVSVGKGTSVISDKKEWEDAKKKYRNG